MPALFASPSAVLRNGETHISPAPRGAPSALTIGWFSPFVAVLCILGAGGPVLAQDRIVGVASVIDGDTIEIHGQRIRLYGIDAPESSQICRRRSGEAWRCGQRASFALADRIGRATIHCRPRDQDRYGRIVAVCFKGGENLNSWMVLNGWAVAYRRYSVDYVADEQAAQTARLTSGPGPS